MMNRLFRTDKVRARWQIARRKARAFRGNEDGGLIIMSIFFFLAMVMMGGLAVDLMRFETQRVINQSTMDRAVLAAASLNQELDPTEVIIDYYVKAGMAPPPPSSIVIEESYVGGNYDADGNAIAGATGELVGRRVEISSAVASPNYFLTWNNVGDLYEDEFEALKEKYGLDRGGPPNTPNFNSVAGSAALERIQNVEVSLVVDISGSMGSNSRMTNLKKAARSFFDTVVDETRTEGITSISVIPYNASVVTGDLLDYLNADGEERLIPRPAFEHPGALTSYRTEHNNSTCVRFRDSDFRTVPIGPNTPLERLSHFDEGRNSYNTPTMGKRWCNENRASILVHSTSKQELKDHINSLSTGGWTAVDLGVKWGAALLDPAMRPVIANMIDDDIVGERAEDRPNDYVPEETVKALVVMTDGANTVQRDLKDQFKYGPSRIWHDAGSWQDPDDSSRGLYDPEIGRRLTWRDDYYVEIPETDTTDRLWYRPGHWNTQNDNRFYAEDELPDSAVQQDYIQLHERFAEEDIARFFFRHVDTTAYNQHRNAVHQFTGYSAADKRMRDMCFTIKDHNGDGVLDEDDKGAPMIFTIAFEAPNAAKQVMQYCATNGKDGGFYYETDGTGLTEAFNAIAGQITQLRLTQ